MVLIFHTMKIEIVSVFSLFTILFIISCNNSSSIMSESMTFTDVNYVNNFPEVISIEDSREPALDVIGVRSFTIYDSLLILSTVNEKGLWSFFSLNTQKHLGDFLSRGQGPFEFIWPPSVSNYVNFTNRGGINAHIYDSQTGRLLNFDIGESLKNKELNLSVEKDSLPLFLFNFVMLEDSLFLCKEVNTEQTQQIRYIITTSTKIIPEIFQPLNRATLREGEDINILSTITKLSPENNKIVEMPIGLNYLNIYSLDDSFAKTICLGKKLDDINKIQDKKRWERLYTFADLRIYRDFFGVVYINEEEKIYQTARARLPSILLFNWEGEALCEIKPGHFITSFDIDFINGELYTLDIHSDEFYKYNIREILKKIETLMI